MEEKYAQKVCYFGLQHTGSTGTVQKRKSMKFLKCNFKNKCSELSENERKQIFNRYWMLGSYERRIDFISNNTLEDETKHRSKLATARQRNVTA